MTRLRQRAALWEVRALAHTGKLQVVEPAPPNPTAGDTMNRIVHLALKVEDIDRTTEFYEKVFGFREVETKKTRDHTSRHLSDGAIDFTLIKYDAGTQSAESKASGEKPCIHHFAVEVEDIEKSTAEIKSYGCEIISDPGIIPVKFRAPGGTVAELVPIGRYKKPKFD
jgi:lactoylglutathione lyase